MSTAEEHQMSSVPEYSKCFIRLQHLWRGKTKEEFRKYMQEKLSSSADPYRMALVNIKLCPDLFKCKQDSLVANLLVELQTFMSQEDNGQKFEACLTEELQGEVYDLAIRQKNTGVLKLLVRVFQLRKRSERYLPSLKTLLQQGQYKEVCLFAPLLGLESQFTTEELIIPLFLEDRLPLADSLLESSPPHQKELILLIDDIIGNKITMADLQKYKIKDPKKIRSSKILCGVLAKLLKKFDLPPTLCPHFQKYRATGGLRFLFFKYYIEKTLQKSTFYSLIDDSLKETPSIQIELLNLFVDYCDAPGALPYVKTLQLSPADIPVQVQEAMHQYPHLLQQGRNMEEDRRVEEESWDEEIGNYFTLDTPMEKIIFVDSVPLFTKCIESINQSSLLAVDSEWKPSFGIGGTEQAALLQFATPSDVFLLDLLSLQTVLQPSHWESIGQLFANPGIAKLGYGIKGDFRILGGLHAEIKKGIMAAKNVIDFDLTKNILLEVYPHIFSYKGENHKGLSDLIYRCFGLSLNKRERFSNWAARPLTTSQLSYAALDVHCLISTYCYLNDKASQLRLPDWKTIQRKPVPAEKKAKGKSPDKSKTLDTAKRQMTPYTQQRKPVKAADFKVVCDTMVQGLARQLRSCGVDAVALDSGEESEHCITYHLREGRVVLSRGRSYQSLTKHIHPQHIYNVSGSTAQDQLAEVISEFRVKVEHGQGDSY